MTRVKKSPSLPSNIKTFAEFWPYYVRDHSHPFSRVLHVCGTSLGLVLLLTAVCTGSWWLLLIAPIGGYGFAWVGHFVFE